MSFLKLDTVKVPGELQAFSIEEFNAFVAKYATKENYGKIILTESDNIAQETLRHLPASLIWQRGNRFEFHYIDGDTHIRVYFATRTEETLKIDSGNAIKAFPGLLKVIPEDDKITPVKITTCPEAIKESAYYNYCNDRYAGFVIDDCSSLDCNSSFFAAMTEVFPETKPWADKFQAKKLKIKAIPKDQRTKAQNEYLQYDKIFIGWLNNNRYHRHNAWTRIIDASNRRVAALRAQIEANGNTVLIVNTDAVKFIGDFDYTPSIDMGGFKYEYQHEQMYVKSVKSYAVTDHGRWKFKQAGKCKLDLVKPRDQWTLNEFINGPTEKVAKIVIYTEDTDIPYLKEIYD